MAHHIDPRIHECIDRCQSCLEINDSHMSVFEYPRADAAAADAALMRQPGRLVLITWISTPRFYRQSRLIVLCVGCATEIVGALDETLGPPFLIGTTPCELSR